MRTYFELAAGALLVLSTMRPRCTKHTHTYNIRELHKDIKICCVTPASRQTHHHDAVDPQVLGGFSSECAFCLGFSCGFCNSSPHTQTQPFVCHVPLFTQFMTRNRFMLHFECCSTLKCIFRLCPRESPQSVVACAQTRDLHPPAGVS